MKSITLTALLALSVGAYALQEVAQDADMHAAPQTEEHAWLQQLVGDWTCVAEANMGPGTEPMRIESTEHVRSIGGLWILAEGAATIEGTQMSTVMTIGYDPRQEKYVGSWVDSTQTHFWTYVGKLDDARTTLTLEAEGPDFGDPSKTALYRDAIALEGKDKKVMTSSVRGADGKWTSFMRAEYTRKAKAK
jgi:hypothetical protein